VTLCALALSWSAADARDGAAPGIPLRVRIETPRGGQTGERVVPVSGVVEGLESGRVTLVLNGIAGSVPVEGGRFSIQQVLAPGWNGIVVSATRDGTTVRDERSVFADVPRKDLRITLTWDTPATDIDLWITGPDGEKILYSHKQGAAGGSLDTDVTTGFGPETYTQAQAPAGTYRVQAHYFGAAQARPTAVTVTAVLFEGSPQEERQVIRGVLLAPGEVLAVGEVVVP
jgi:uncharacterized protein YfaP (DUF2135 family)